MSSDGKPLWGFRKIFFLAAIFYWVCAIWTLVELMQPENLAGVNQPGSANHSILIAIIPVCALLGIAYLWFWIEIRNQRFTKRNWVIGLLLLIPSLLCFPWGILPIISWCAKTCRGLFIGPDPLPSQPPPLSGSR